MIRVYSLLVVLALSGTLFAQQKKCDQIFYTPKSGTVCYAKAEDAFTFVGPPEEYTRRLQSQARTQSANIEVTYDGFTADAQAALPIVPGCSRYLGFHHSNFGHH